MILAILVQLEMGSGQIKLIMGDLGFNIVSSFIVLNGFEVVSLAEGDVALRIGLRKRMSTQADQKTPPAPSPFPRGCIAIPSSQRSSVPSAHRFRHLQDRHLQNRDRTPTGLLLLPFPSHKPHSLARPILSASRFGHRYPILLP